jgi:hypothetical protein
VNGHQAVTPSALGRKTVQIDAPGAIKSQPLPVDLAVNVFRNGFPSPSASINSSPQALYQALDGRVWFYPDVKKYWTTQGSQSAEDWFSVDFGAEKPVSSVKLYFYSDGSQFNVPVSYTLQYWKGQDWADIPNVQKSPASPLGNGENTVTFASMNISTLRVSFTNPAQSATALVEIKAF